MAIILGTLGFFGFIGSIIWVIVNLIRKKPLKLPVIIFILALIMFVSGVAMETPTSSVTVVEDIEGNEEEITKDLATNGEADEVTVESEPENENNNQAEDEGEDEDENDIFDNPTTGNLEVHFIDVGQGDSILIKTPSKNILIDGGDRGTTALNYIRNQGVKSLNYIISTHPHADHIGGLINIIQSIPVGEVIDPAVPHTTKTFEDYFTLIDQKEIWFTEGRSGMTFDIGGGANMQILHPTAPSQSDLNNASIVIKLTFGNVSFLLAGDAEGSAESQILNRGYDLNSTILKVGHHGSKTSSTQAFLNAVKPEVAVIMCSKNNSYGHPHEETLSKLSAVNAEIYRTDLHGNIVIITDGQTYSINKEPYAYAENQQPPPSNEQVIVPPMIIEGEYVGSISSDKYHYPSCSYAESIKESNRIWFDSVQAAAAASYVACKGCNPPGASITPTPTPEPTPPPATTQAAFVGSKNSDKYHYPSCGHAKKILPANLVTFNSVADARSKGYVPCGSCKPPGN